MRSFRLVGAGVVVIMVAVLGLLSMGCQSLLGSKNTPRAERVFAFTYRAQVSPPPAGAKRIALWIPVPLTDANQTIEALVLESPFPYTFHNEPEYGNRYAYLEVDARAVKAPFDVTLRFRVRRREHRVDVRSRMRAQSEIGLVGGQPIEASFLAGLFGTVVDATNRNLQRHLQPDRLVPLDGVIAALAEQEVGTVTDPLAKARRVYDYVVSTLRYDKSGDGWGRGDVLYACDAKAGNCTDFHSVFIGMLRPSGVPARFEIGFQLPPDLAKGAIGGYHCWASFYIEGLGWVPVDTSEAWKHPEKRAYFFGAHDPDRVLFTLGRDIALEPAQQGEPLNYFIYPYAEVDGKEVSVQTEFSFSEL